MHIVHVDDEEDIRLIVSMALEISDAHQVTSFASAPEAIAALPELKPDLILMDMYMPNMNGDEALQLIRQSDHSADIPVVIFSALADRAEVDRLKSLGCNGMMPKPFDPQNLERDLMKMLSDGLAGN